MITARVGQRRVLREGIAVGWLLACAAGFLAPALSHGSAIGPYDLQSALGLTSTAHPYVHNAVASDQIQQFIPWQVLSWLQVHAGHAPLWQPANLLGMPLAFNFQSAPFSLAVAVGYALPLALAHTGTIAVELVLAGTGTYVLGRMLRLGVLPAVLGATIFELCGAFTIWLGVYEAGCCCFLGWTLAASVALLRGRRRAVPLVMLAIGLALAFASGEPQIDAFFVAFLAVFVIVAVVRGWAGTAQHLSGDGTASAHVGLRRWRARMLLDHGLALVAASCLVAPIYLPGIQVLLRSARVHGPYVSGLPPHNLVNLLLPWYSGVPTNLTSIVGPDSLYVASVYVGAIGLVLALAGLAYVRRRPEVLAFAIAAVLLVVGLYAPPVAAVMRHIPEVKVFRVDLGTTFLDFSLAMLAAFGAQALLGPNVRGDGGSTGDAVPAETRWAGRLFLGGSVALGVVLLGFGLRLVVSGGPLTQAQRSVRTASFLWPAIGVGACLVVALAWHLRRRWEVRSADTGGWPRRALGSTAAAVSGRLGLGALVLAEAAFCVISGAWFLSSTTKPFHPTPAVATLQRTVGGKLVAIGACPELHSFPPLGLMPDDNAAYGVDEFTDYDPIMTIQYYGGLANVTGMSRTPPAGEHALFCPSVTSADVARYFGVSYVLEPSGARGPKGTHLVAQVHNEAVFAVPDSGRATLLPLGTGIKGAERAGQPVQLAHESSAGTWHVEVRADRRSLLLLRVTSVPGWQATIDGKPLQLHTFGTVMLAATVPPGRHVVILRYWPRLWSVGLILAGIAAVALAVALAAAGVLRYRSARGSSQRNQTSGGAAAAVPEHV